MSRLAKKPILIPKDTTVSVSDEVMHVKGPLGELSRSFKPEISISVKDGTITLERVRNSIETRALWGTYAAHVKNMLHGVNTLFEKKLIIEGIGFKAEVKGEEVLLNLGFSHPIKVPIPKGIKVVVEKGSMTIKGLDIELVGRFAATIRDLKKPEPYKGKGIRYSDEVVKRKQGKKTA